MRLLGITGLVLVFGLALGPSDARASSEPESPPKMQIAHVTPTSEAKTRKVLLDAMGVYTVVSGLSFVMGLPLIPR